MKKFFLTALVFVIAISCTQNKASIKGIVQGTAKGDLVLKVLEVNSQKTIDTIKIEDGKIDYSLKLKDKSPNFYYLYYNNNKVASLVLLPGDNIKLITDTLGMKLSVEGSLETTLLLDIEQKTELVKTRFDSLSTVLQNAVDNKDIEKQSTLNYQLGSLYVKQKQYAIKHLYTYPNSITNISLLYQKFPNELPIFADYRDVLLFKRVYDSLIVKYPESVLVSKLMEVISYKEKSDLLTAKIQQAAETGYPNISLPDNKANIRSISDFAGKVIILSFWSVNDVNQKMLNQDYLQIYDRYHSKGLEVFQVSVDEDKTAWARAIDEQMIPWTSVCDGLGSNSPAFKTYNLTKVPALFVIDKSGTIVAKDVYGAELDKLISTLVVAQ